MSISLNTLTEIEALFAHAESELELEAGSVRELIAAADAKLFKAESMIGLPEDPTYTGMANWPGRIGRYAATLVDVERRHRAERSVEGYNPRKAAYLRIRKEKLQRCWNCCNAVTDLVEAVKAMNGGKLP